MRVSVRVSIFLSFFHLVAFLLFDLLSFGVRKVRGEIGRGCVGAAR